MILTPRQDAKYQVSNTCRMYVLCIILFGTILVKEEVFFVRKEKRLREWVTAEHVMFCVLKEELKTGAGRINGRD